MTSNGDVAINRIKRVVWLIVGWAFLITGALGFVLPILPGIPLIAFGLIVLSSEYVWAHNLIQRLREHFPKTIAKIEKFSGRFARPAVQPNS